LPGRRNIVLTRSNVTGAEVYSSFDAIPSDVLIGSFVIGGAQMYKEALQHPLCHNVYMTKIPGNYECDTFFPIELLDDFRGKMNYHGCSWV
jgi:dihydrofolate reductase